MRILFLAAIIALSTTAVLAQQPQKPTASEIYHKLVCGKSLRQLAFEVVGLKLQ